MDLIPILQSLSTKRPIFHSEADFQHALAWELQSNLPDAQIRLEYRPFPNERFYLDVSCVTGSERFAIELKYLTRGLDIEIQGERFLLKNQAAQDISRHDVVKDIVRLERVTAEVPGTIGYAVVLTNDPSYWKASLRTTTVDAAFRIHHGRKLTGSLTWAEAASPGTKRGREHPLQLRSSYSIEWRDYSQLGGMSFRYLLAEIQADPLTGGGEIADA